MKTGTPPDSGVFLTLSHHLQSHRSLDHQFFPQLPPLSRQPTITYHHTSNQPNSLRTKGGKFFITCSITSGDKMVDTVGINETTEWNLLKTILRASNSTFFKMSSARTDT